MHFGRVIEALGERAAGLVDENPQQLSSRFLGVHERFRVHSDCLRLFPAQRISGARFDTEESIVDRNVPACPVQEHVHRVDRDLQVLGNFLIAPAFDAMEAEDLCLSRYKMSQRESKALRKLGIQSALGRRRLAAGHNFPIRSLLPCRTPVPLPQAIDRACRCQP